jgi:hypothetical protein
VTKPIYNITLIYFINIMNLTIIKTANQKRVSTQSHVTGQFSFNRRIKVPRLQSMARAHRPAETKHRASRTTLESDVGFANADKSVHDSTAAGKSLTKKTTTVTTSHPTPCRTNAASSSRPRLSKHRSPKLRASHRARSLEASRSLRRTTSLLGA